MSNDESRRQFEEWARHRYGKDELQIKPDEDELGEYSDEYVNHLIQGEWEAWQAATVGPDAATVALHFGYEVTKIRDQVFIAKNNACGKVWVPFSRDSHPQVFMEYEKCL